MLSNLNAFALFERNAAAVSPTSQAASDPAVEREVSYWRGTIGTVRSPADLIRDERLLAFATRAFGFDEDAPNRALVQLALEQGSADPQGYANRSPDWRLESMTRAFGFAEFGTASVRDARFVERVAQQYRARSAAVTTTDAPPRDAYEVERAYFKATIGSVSNAAEVVADSRLYDYAMKAFGLENRKSDTALMQQVMSEGADGPGDVAILLGDEKLQALGRAFSFDAVGDRYVSAEPFGETVARRYELATGRLGTAAKEGESDETRRFREAIGQVTEIEQLVSDPELFDYVMTAFDLAGQKDRTGIVRKVLEEGVSERNTLGNRLGDPRYAEMAQTLAFAEYGVRNLQDPAVIDAIAARYERASSEIEAGQDNPAVELAAYFDRKADTLSSWYHVLADTRLRGVVLTALALPPEMGTLDVDRLAGELADRFDLADLRDAGKREGFIRRYLVLADEPAAPQSAVVGLFGGGGGGAESLYGIVAQLR